MKRFVLLFCLLFTLTLAAAEAQNSISIDSRVDKSKITIGDLIKYTVEVTHSPKMRLQAPELAANLGMFEIRDYSVHEPVTREGQVLERMDYTISTFEVGEFEIPELTYYYSFPGDSTRHELKTERIGIVVESLKPSEAGDIRDIKTPLSLPRDYRKIIIWTSLALALLVLLGVSFYIWRRHRAGKGILPQRVEPPRPAHETALAALSALRASSLLAEGRVKEYYIELSEIIRRYIEGRYFITALELTSLELISDLRRADVEVENIELIQSFLEVCDLVKFAKLIPPPAQNEAVTQKAFDLVEKTKLLYDVALDGTANGEHEASTMAAGSNAPPLAENQGENGQAPDEVKS